MLQPEFQDSPEEIGEFIEDWFHKEKRAKDGKAALRDWETALSIDDNKKNERILEVLWEHFSTVLQSVLALRYLCASATNSEKSALRPISGSRSSLPFYNLLATALWHPSDDDSHPLERVPTNRSVLKKEVHFLIQRLLSDRKEIGERTLVSKILSTAKACDNFQRKPMGWEKDTSTARTEWRTHLGQALVCSGVTQEILMNHYINSMDLSQTLLGNNPLQKNTINGERTGYVPDHMLEPPIAVQILSLVEPFSDAQELARKRFSLYDSKKKERFPSEPIKAKRSAIKEALDAESIKQDARKGVFHVSSATLCLLAVACGIKHPSKIQEIGKERSIYRRNLSSLLAELGVVTNDVNTKKVADAMVASAPYVSDITLNQRASNHTRHRREIIVEEATEFTATLAPGSKIII
jgi:hypothetical protein